MKLLSIALIAALAAGAAPAADPFSLTSSSFRDGGALAVKYKGKRAPNCSGDNVSPALAWSNVPESTKSIVITIFDPDGRQGLGVSHFLGYGIRPDLMSFGEGELSVPSPKFIGGRNTPYGGPCPPPGGTVHHYVFTVLATDLEPGALAPGLSREDLITQLAGHVKGGSTLIGLSNYQ